MKTKSKLTEECSDETSLKMAQEAERLIRLILTIANHQDSAITGAQVELIDNIFNGTASLLSREASFGLAVERVFARMEQFGLDAWRSAEFSDRPKHGTN